MHSQHILPHWELEWLFVYTRYAPHRYMQYITHLDLAVKPDPLQLQRSLHTQMYRAKWIWMNWIKAQRSTKAMMRLREELLLSQTPYSTKFKTNVPWIRAQEEWLSANCRKLREKRHSTSKKKKYIKTAVKNCVCQNTEWLTLRQLVFRHQLGCKHVFWKVYMATWWQRKKAYQQN